jgi:2-C-methyl-D-erythritol 4-phosphate cytidylyltransferase
MADEVGGLLACPVSDTLKEAQAHRVVSTISRQDKWVAQTPQMFRLQLLQEALRTASATITDEASAVEALGHKPLLVCSPIENFKVTYPHDFDLALRLLSTRQE